MSAPKISDADMTDRIRCALRVHFQDARRFCFLEEVGNATGFANAGWADAIVLQLWPSDGLELWGFEIKSSRTDWLKELRNPKKSENVARFCDRWIVVAPKGLVRAGELPPAWGLWQYDSETEKLSFTSKGEHRPKAKYIPRAFFASLLRRTQETIPAAAFIARISAAAHRDAGRTWKRSVAEERERAHAATRKLEEMREVLHAHGFTYNEWRRTIEKRATA